MANSNNKLNWRSPSQVPLFNLSPRPPASRATTLPQVSSVSDGSPSRLPYDQGETKPRRSSSSSALATLAAAADSFAPLHDASKGYERDPFAAQKGRGGNEFEAPATLTSTASTNLNPASSTSSGAAAKETRKSNSEENGAATDNRGALHGIKNSSTSRSSASNDRDVIAIGAASSKTSNASASKTRVDVISKTSTTSKSPSLAPNEKLAIDSSTGRKKQRKKADFSDDRDAFRKKKRDSDKAKTTKATDINSDDDSAQGAAEDDSAEEAEINKNAFVPIGPVEDDNDTSDTSSGSSDNEEEALDDNTIEDEAEKLLAEDEEAEGVTNPKTEQITSPISTSGVEKSKKKKPIKFSQIKREPRDFTQEEDILFVYLRKVRNLGLRDTATGLGMPHFDTAAHYYKTEPLLKRKQLKRELKARLKVVPPLRPGFDFFSESKTISQAGQQWADLPKEEKDYWEKVALADRNRYKEDLKKHNLTWDDYITLQRLSFPKHFTYKGEELNTTSPYARMTKPYEPAEDFIANELLPRETIRRETEQKLISMPIWFNLPKRHKGEDFILTRPRKVPNPKNCDF